MSDSKIIRFVGVDVETTGIDPTQDYVVQLGLSLGAMLVFERDVRISHEELFSRPDYEGAFKVNGFTVERATSNSQVPRLGIELGALRWLDDNLGIDPVELHAVGRNVGSFDLVLLKRLMPNLAARFHYRSIEVSTLRYVLDDSVNEMRQRVVEILGCDRLHSAGWDAAEALITFQLYREKFRA